MINPKLHVNVGIPNSKMLGLDYFKRAVDLCQLKDVDIICDMSLDINSTKQRFGILKDTSISICTVPLYEYYLRYSRKYNYKVDKIAFLELLEKHVSSGANYVLLHSAFSRSVFEHLENSQRIIKMSSRGGGIIWKHFQSSPKENPLFSEIDEILNILKKYDAAFFLGAASRPGTICDGLDGVFLHEMEVQKRIIEAAREKEVNVIVEGVGHCTIPELTKWVTLAREMFGRVELKPLPIITDIGCGLDHISNAIAVYHCTKMGVEFLCCMTPAEHLGMPDLQDIETGIDVTKLAIHAAMIEMKEENKIPDRMISVARDINDWNKIFHYSINPNLAKKKFLHLNEGRIKESCSMCDEICPKLLVKQFNES